LLVADNRGWQPWVIEGDGREDTNFVWLVFLSFCSSTAPLLATWGEKKKEGHRMKLLCVLVMTCGRMKAKVGMTCLLFLVFFFTECLGNDGEGCWSGLFFFSLWAAADLSRKKKVIVLLGFFFFVFERCWCVWKRMKEYVGVFSLSFLLFLVVFLL